MSTPIKSKDDYQEKLNKILKLITNHSSKYNSDHLLDNSSVVVLKMDENFVYLQFAATAGKKENEANNRFINYIEAKLNINRETTGGFIASPESGKIRLPIEHASKLIIANLGDTEHLKREAKSRSDAVRDQTMREREERGGISQPTKAFMRHQEAILSVEEKKRSEDAVRTHFTDSVNPKSPPKRR